MSRSVKWEHCDVNEVSIAQTLPDVAVCTRESDTLKCTYIYRPEDVNTGNNKGTRDCLRSQKLNIT